ncbi:MAG: tRNA (5-methylaminomethyl-2-thiouridine)(34)-methyltransferase MnmD [Bacteroidota bacterium]|nr:tRNA (5-methylaminomethyl-2-thiouridine)(34)-methyltransferase MnmD [Bacteroidota bacterium]
MKINTVISGDGSSSRYVPEMDEYYHSSHGAITESRHIFINAGLKQVHKDHVDIFEVGFGTGLNALLSFQYALEHGISINYQGIEKYPLPPGITDLLNYAEMLDFSGARIGFKKLHRSEWDREHRLHPLFHFTKIHADALEHIYPRNRADLIYFDAFAPDKQSEMWTREIFQKMFLLLRQGGSLLTYSAKGQLKRDLRTCGFRVESLAGPPGKREISRAVKDPG